MEFVLDANALFSALIKEGAAARVIVSEQIMLFAPEFLFDEFLEHKKEILSKTKRSEQEFYFLVESLKEIINVSPKKEFEMYLGKAKNLISDVDDIPYLALALKLNIPIWSNDKKLKKQNIIKVYSTSEILKIIVESGLILPASARGYRSPKA